MPGTGGPLRLQMSPSRLLSASVTACLFPGSLARPGRVPPGTTFRTRLLSPQPPSLPSHRAEPAALLLCLWGGLLDVGLGVF